MKQPHTVQEEYKDLRLDVYLGQCHARGAFAHVH